MPVSRRLVVPVSLLLLSALACSLPGLDTLFARPTRAAATPSRVAQAALTPVTPTLVETIPAPGEELRIDEPITLYFDQAMDKTSVEQAFALEPSVRGRFSWPDSATLVFTPSRPLERSTTYRLTIDAAARSSAGLPFVEDIVTPIQTVGDLLVAQVSPAPDASDVQPEAIITVAFNRPVVPLQIEGEAPQPLTFEPAIAGEGAWVDTGIYLFTPTAPLPGGVTFTAQVEAGMEDLTGGILEEAYTWSFTTSLPRLLTTSPEPGSRSVGREATILLTFNQAMDLPSVESALSITRQGVAVPGTVAWDESHTQLTFTPDQLLDYDTIYRLNLTMDALGSGGENLSEALDTSFRTVPLPAIIGSQPRSNGELPAYQSVRIDFSSSMDPASLLKALEITPAITNRSAYFSPGENFWYVYGDFAPATEYTLTLQETAADLYGTTLLQPFRLTFNTADLPPTLGFMRYGEVLSLSAGVKPVVEVQAINVNKIDYQLYRLTLEEAQLLLADPSFPSQSYEDKGEPILVGAQTIQGTANIYTPVRLALQDEPLSTGLYLLQLESSAEIQRSPGRVLLVRNAELVLKISKDKAFVWAVDIRTGQAIPSLPIRLVDETGQTLANGSTDAQGIAELSYALSDPYDPVYAISGSPGDDLFGMTGSFWTEGINAYEFDVWQDLSPLPAKAYVYTDRPIYRPGTPVRFRGILRQVGNARYALPDLASLRVSINDPTGEQVYTQMLPLSEYGTFDGEFALASGAPLGYYNLETEFGGVGFQVAAYRKPEFTVTVEPSAVDVAQGDALTAQIAAEYFFGGPVAGAKVRWTAWLMPYYPPGLYRSIDWFAYAEDSLFVEAYATQAEGEGITGPDGRLKVKLPTALYDSQPQVMTIEATITDTSGLPVSGRSTVHLHSAAVYLSLAPERYALRAGEQALVRLRSAGWNDNPIAGQQATIDVESVTWEQVIKPDGNIGWEDQALSLLADYTLATEADGSVSFAFTPETGGTYRVRARTEDPEGRPATSDLLLWVSGPGGPIWRQAPAGRMALVPDRESYQVGETAHILVPSPFGGTVPALLTVERGGVLSHRVLQLNPQDSIFEVPIEALHAPNIYVSVVLVKPTSAGGLASIATGLVELKVDAEAMELQVSITPDRTTAQPGQDVTCRLEARDSQGNPVQGEFSLGLADLAALTLVEPNSVSPFTAFYSPQPLGVNTAASLTLSAEGAPPPPQELGRGGGGEGALAAEIRREFPDTAYWNASVVTDSTGLAEVTITLPDSLTTWRMDARGVTTDTLVGSATFDIVATKDLLIRPVTPRFFTAGDAATVAAVVNNRTSADIPVEARLVASGADITSQASLSATVPAGGEHRVEWSLLIHDTETVDLTFHVEGGGLQDASKPTIGTTVDGLLPVLRYSAPDTAATAGILDEAGERVEAINLPRRFDATRGELQVMIDPSLGSAMDTALAALDIFPYECTEQIVSRFLPNAAVYRALRDLELDDPELKQRLDKSMAEGLQALTARRHDDGGWSWWYSGPTDPYLTAYVLYGLVKAKEVEASVPDYLIEGAVGYLSSQLAIPGKLDDPAERGRQIFILYALEAAGSGDPDRVRELASPPENLDLWARALAAQMLSKPAGDSALLQTILSDFETEAIRSATGAHWEDDTIDRWNLGSSTRTTAHVLQALMLLKGDSPLIPNAVQWLLHARGRDGGWRSTHETAWAILVLTDWMKETQAMQAEYSYAIALNGVPWSSGEAHPGTPVIPITLTETVAKLLADQPNQLSILRGPGAGSLFYTAHLTVYRPIEDVQPSSHGITVSREYFRYDGQCGDTHDPCSLAPSARVGDDLQVRVTLTVPADQYYLALEDPFPAGTDPLDPHLRTSATPLAPAEVALADPLRGGWGWWWFTRSELRDDHLFLFADYLPAGTYQYTYVLHTTLPGEYRIAPTRAWAFYFPEVYGQAAGRVFTIQP